MILLVRSEKNLNVYTFLCRCVLMDFVDNEVMTVFSYTEH